jgi:hypothetical protein
VVTRLSEPGGQVVLVRFETADAGQLRHRALDVAYYTCKKLGTCQKCKSQAVASAYAAKPETPRPARGFDTCRADWGGCYCCHNPSCQPIKMPRMSNISTCRQRGARHRCVAAGQDAPRTAQRTALKFSWFHFSSCSLSSMANHRACCSIGRGLLETRRYWSQLLSSFDIARWCILPKCWESATCLAGSWLHCYQLEIAPPSFQLKMSVGQKTAPLQQT